MNAVRPHANIDITDDGAVRVLRIDREDKLGALSASLVEALSAEFARVAADEQVRAMVLTGTGRGFIAGADIGEYEGADPDTFVEYQHKSRAVFDALEALPIPTIAAVNGYAFGGGFELALCCDIILASESARFSLPEVKLGIIPGGGGTQRLTRAAGPRFAKEVIMTGRTVRSDEALRRGIAAAVIPDDELDSAARSLARQLAAGPSQALREIKRLVDRAPGRELGDGLADEQATLAQIFSSADAQEGIAAFSQKRDPEFGMEASR